ncbi:CHAT domain-containing protein [Kribbella sp. NPDC026611]|uniref:CHAT domain-containing protein n=1 Tax=Kribbella sp. NPDC026611 TaxID=3154911 RepID=UPI00340895B1
MAGIWGRGPGANRGRALRFLRGVTSRYERSQDPTELLADKTVAGVQEAMRHAMRSTWDLPLVTSEVDAEVALEVGKYYWYQHLATKDDAARGVAMEFLGLARRAGSPLRMEASSRFFNRVRPDDIPGPDDRPVVDPAAVYGVPGQAAEPEPEPDRDLNFYEWVAAVVEHLLPHAAEVGVDVAAAELAQQLPAQFDIVQPGLGSDVASEIAIRVAEDRSNPRLAVDLAEALFSEAAAIAPDRARRSSLAANLGELLRGRFVVFGNEADLEGSLEAGRTAKVLAEGDTTVEAAAFNIIGAALLTRGRRRSSLDDLRGAVDALFQATQRARPDDPARPGYLDLRGIALRELAVATGDLARLDDAVEIGAAAVRLSPSPADAQANLAETLIARLDRTGRLADLDEAYDAAAQAVDAGRNAQRLRQLGRVLLRRYEWRHDPADLDKAIATYDAALDFLPEQDPLRADVASDLGLTYQRRFARFAEKSDLYNAIYYGSMATEPSRDGGTARARRLSNYAVALDRSLGDADDAQLAAESVMVARQAADAEPAGHPDRPRYLHNYVTTYLREHRDNDELDRVVSAAAEAVDSLRDPRYLSLYVTALLARYDATAAADDLTRADRAAREALDSAAADDPLRYQYLIGLANVRVRESRGGGNSQAAREAIELSREIVADGTAPTLVRAEVGKVWGEVAAELGDWTAALEGFGAAVELLPRLVWRSLEYRERRRLVAELAGLPSPAASAALTEGLPERAVELLETGRAVLASPHDVSDPELVDLHRRLNNLMDSFAYWSGPDRREAARRWDELTAQAKVGPTPYEELREAAVDGPVILVNVRRYRCDAMIITTTGLTVVPLPDLRLAEVVQRAEDFSRAVAEPRRLRSRVVVKQTCDWLWATIADPVAAQLEAGSRVWWCVTGPLMSLPLHAAGEVTDRLISSYTPTLAALIAARQRPGVLPWRSAVLVGMPETPGLPALHHAERELEVAGRRLPQPELLVGPAATHDDVMRSLQSADVVHFACHGRQDADVPGDGRLILADQDLTIADLITSSAVPQFAFLSACETARGDAGVPDESLHLAGTLFLAGCPQVIGTIWPVSDAASVDVVADVYDELPAAGPASALHAAVAKVRRRYPDDPMRWASHVYFGP